MADLGVVNSTVGNGNLAHRDKGVDRQHIRCARFAPLVAYHGDENTLNDPEQSNNQPSVTPSKAHEALFWYDRNIRVDKAPQLYFGELRW